MEKTDKLSLDLSEFNRCIEQISFGNGEESTPHRNIFIVGVPRSGTTIASQLLSFGTNVGYVNNLMAAFWSNPILGALFSTKWELPKSFSGISNYGQTELIAEPHEFGAFWRKALGYIDITQELNKTVDLHALNRILNQVGGVFALPVVYKTFHLMWHLKAFHRVNPKSCWIFIEREPIENALSILELRYSRYNNFETWVGARPLGVEQYTKLGFLAEVLAQVYLINDWIKKELSAISSENYLHFSLNEIQQSPVGFIKSVSSKFGLELSNFNPVRVESKILQSPPTYPIHVEQYRAQLEEIQLAYFT